MSSARARPRGHGPSGSGKSTLFRAIAGIWPYGKGKIEIPAGKSVMLLPQKPYLPLGTLRNALAYPAAAADFSDADIIAAMEKVGLSHLAQRLDQEDLWSRSLSGGEQQRVAIVRALLKKPDWLFLDEATAALDEPMEAKIYTVLKESLPDTTVVSIGHRATLLNFHSRRIDMRPDGNGAFMPVDTGQRLSRQSEGPTCARATFSDVGRDRRRPMLRASAARPLPGPANPPISCHVRTLRDHLAAGGCAELLPLQRRAEFSAALQYCADAAYSGGADREWRAAFCADAVGLPAGLRQRSQGLPLVINIRTETVRRSRASATPSTAAGR